MFDIGFWEMAFIGVVALVVIGPEKLPGVVRSVGGLIGKGRRIMYEIKADFKSEMSATELAELQNFRKEMSGAKQGFTAIKDNVKKATGVEEIKRELKNIETHLQDDVNNEIQNDVKLASEKTPLAQPISKKPTQKKLTKKKTIKKKIAKKKNSAVARKKTGTKKIIKKSATKKSTQKKTVAKKTPAKINPET